MIHLAHKVYTYSTYPGLPINPIFHCPGPTGICIFWRLIVENNMKHEKSELFMYSSMNSLSFFFYFRTSLKLYFSIKIIHLTQKTKIKWVLNPWAVEAWPRSLTLKALCHQNRIAWKWYCFKRLGMNMRRLIFKLILTH
jgi:hypothetical protein